MHNKKILLALILFFLGMAGIASILTIDIPLPEEAAAILEAQFTDWQIKLLILVNPTLMLLIAVVVGVLLHDKVNLRVPLIEKLLTGKSDLAAGNVFKYGLAGGGLAGILLGLIGLVFYPLLPETFLALSENLKLTLAARFLYGGFTEEILLRFGLMTLLVWIIAKISKKTTNGVYWTGILIAALLFAFGHFPVAYQAMDNPPFLLLTYILIGNAVGGIIFGWLYWKKGLESAFLAHMVTHLFLLLGEAIRG